MAARPSSSGSQEVQIDDFTAQSAHAAEDAPRVAADVQPHLGAQAVHALDHALLERPDELLIDVRPDQRGGRIADADQVGAGRHLGGGKVQLHGEHELEQPLHEVGVVVEVEHQVVDAAQVGGLGARAFDPALDQLAFADTLLSTRRSRPGGSPCARSA